MTNKKKYLYAALIPCTLLLLFLSNCNLFFFPSPPATPAATRQPTSTPDGGGITPAPTQTPTPSPQPLPLSLDQFYFEYTFIGETLLDASHPILLLLIDYTAANFTYIYRTEAEGLYTINTADLSVPYNPQHEYALIVYHDMNDNFDILPYMDMDYYSFYYEDGATNLAAIDASSYTALNPGVLYTMAMGDVLPYGTGQLELIIY